MAGADTRQYSGAITGDKVIVADSDDIEQLSKTGYGEMSGNGLALEEHEALYLVYTESLRLVRNGRAVSFDAYMRHVRAHTEDALVRFLIYRDLRTRGYTVRNGFGFGSDFCVYERGDYGKKGAKYLVFGFGDGKTETAGALQKKVEQIAVMGKEPIVAVVDGRGEVIYYKITPATFAGNKSRRQGSL